MTDSRQMALEALKDSVDLVRAEYETAVALYGKYPTRAAWIDGLLPLLKAHEQAIAALEADIAAKVEPVAWMNASRRVAFTQWDLDGFDDETRVKYSIPLFDAPQQAAAPAGAQLELPPYIYGREVGVTERVLTLQAATDYGNARAAHARKQALEEAAAFIEGGAFLHDQSPAKLFADQLAPKIRSLQ